jgi:hypothetical protein
MVDLTLAILGGVLLVLGSLSCLLGVLRNEVKPNRVSWAIWTVPPTVCFAAQVHARVGPASALTLAIAISSLLVLLATFLNQHGYAKMGPLDWYCALLAAVSTLLWVVTREPDFTVVMLVAIDWLGALPTLVKAYRDPQSESRVTFLLFALGAGVTLATIHNWTLLNYGVSIHTLIMALAIFVVITLAHRRVVARDGRRLDNSGFSPPATRLPTAAY